MYKFRDVNNIIIKLDNLSLILLIKATHFHTVGKAESVKLGPTNKNFWEETKTIEMQGDVKNKTHENWFIAYKLLSREESSKRSKAWQLKVINISTEKQ